jgi:hypothetical protein
VLDDDGNTCDGHVLAEVIEFSSDEKSGPAQVATPAYRAGWEGVFGKKPVVGQA